MLHGAAPQAGKEPAPILTATHVGKPGAGWERRTSARTARRLAVPQHPSPTQVPAVTLPGPGQLSSCSVPPADAKTQWRCRAVSSFASRDTVPTGLLADKEREKLKSVWFWSAVLSKASGLLQSKHNSDEGFRQKLLCFERSVDGQNCAEISVMKEGRIGNDCLIKDSHLF